MQMTVVFAVLVFLAALAVGYFVLNQGKYDEEGKRQKAEKKIAEARAKGQGEVERARAEAKELLERTAQEAERVTLQNNKLAEILANKEQLVKKKEDRNAQFLGSVEEGKRAVSQREREVKELGNKIETSLLQKVGGSKEYLQQQVVAEYEAKWQQDSEDRLRRLGEWAKEDTVKIAKDKLGEAIYKYADPSSGAGDEGVITVAHDRLKERVIGPGGRHLDILEKLYEMDIVLNDGPNTISLSCFNLVKRETAKITIQKLLNEKKVDEAVIRRIHDAAEKDVEKLLLKHGNDAVRKLELKNVHPDLVKLIGRLYYRTSYGQNIMRHCMEVGYFAKMLAATIGANETVAWQAGFFHDIGKAIDQEVGGSHDVLTKEILEKYNFQWEVVHAAWAHHDAVPQETVEALLVKAGDAISAGRPGARSISLEQYIQKIKELEATALSFDGAKKAFAISAGREVRVVVDENRVKDDRGVQELAESIAGKVEEKGGYPGKIKITAIRTTKVSSVTKHKTLARK